MFGKTDAVVVSLRLSARTLREHGDAGGSPHAGREY